MGGRMRHDRDDEKESGKSSAHGVSIPRLQATSREQSRQMALQFCAHCAGGARYSAPYCLKRQAFAGNSWNGLEWAVSMVRCQHIRHGAEQDQRNDMDGSAVGDGADGIRIA